MIKDEQKYMKSPYFQHCESKPFENAWVVFPGDEPVGLEDEELSLLHFCIEQVRYDQLVKMFSKESILKMIKCHFLKEADTAWHIHRLRCVEIETSKYCNWRCSYCPNKDNQNPRTEVMSMQLFHEILKKIQDFGPIQYVTLNTYNEPVLDTFFLERIRLISKFNMKLVLYTNGSVLTPEIIDELKASGCLKEIWFNVPSLLSYRFTELTGSRSFKTVLDNIDRAIEAGLHVNFSIQGQAEERQKTLSALQERYQKRVNHQIISWPTHDRAGSLKGEFNQHIHFKQARLFGCTYVISRLNITTQGDIFLCCNDYYQKHIFGNIKESSISDLLNSERAICLRKQVYGGIDAPEDQICRHCIEMKRQKVLSKLNQGKKG